MTEYIDRTVLLNHLKNCKGQPPEMCYSFAVISEIERFVKSRLAADVAPVVHAKWIDLPKYKSVGGTFQKAQICSACKAFYVSDANTPFSNHRYCADCGAIMDLTENRNTAPISGTMGANGGKE